MGEITAAEIVRLKLATALDSAPRPSVKPDAEWMIKYMDWFFQTRISALDAASVKAGNRSGADGGRE